MTGTDLKAGQLKNLLNWPMFMAERGKRARHPLVKNFYNSNRFTLKTPLKDIEYIALDIETTGLDPQEDDIVSVGAVPFSLERVSCKDARYWLVSPRQPLAETSVTIHGITHSDIALAPDLSKVLEEILEVLAGKIIVVHYHPIERGFFHHAIEARLGEGIYFPVIDTMHIEQTIIRRKRQGILNLLKSRKPLSVRLPDTRLRYGLPAYKSHHALTDALSTAELFQAQTAHHFPPEHPLEKLLI